MKGTVVLGVWLAAVCGWSYGGEVDRGRPWARHAIDESSRGADGVRLADVNGDGRLDVTTGWEEGGVTRVYLHPGNGRVHDPWPAVTVGTTPSVEDAVFADLDGDGRTDVVSSCEGGVRTVFVHWAPTGPGDYLDASAWRSRPLPASVKRMQWMFCVPAQVDGRGGIDLVAGGKGGGAEIGWFESPGDPRRLDEWKWHPMSPAGWIMSLRMFDVDGDGDADVVTSDRKGPMRGCRWLENPGPGAAQAGPWNNHWVGGRQCEVMFLTIADLDRDGQQDVLAAVKPDRILFFRRASATPVGWEEYTVGLPGGIGTGKAVEVGDVDLDGKPDLVFTCENAGGERSGVMWLSYGEKPTEPTWTAHEISGPVGIKYDRIELLDLDGDGDRDLMTCEESQPRDGRRAGLGVIWYENPAR